MAFTDPAVAAIMAERALSSARAAAIEARALARLPKPFTPAAPPCRTLAGGAAASPAFSSAAPRWTGPETLLAALVLVGPLLWWVARP